MIHIYTKNNEFALVQKVPIRHVHIEMTSMTHRGNMLDGSKGKISPLIDMYLKNHLRNTGFRKCKNKAIIAKVLLLCQI